MSEMHCARPGCEEKESRINGYCSVYCEDVDDERQEVKRLEGVVALLAAALRAANVLLREVPIVVTSWGYEESACAGCGGEHGAGGTNRTKHLPGCKWKEYKAALEPVKAWIEDKKP